MTIPTLMPDYKMSFPVFTKTVVDKDGLRVEWTDAGKVLVEQVARQSPLSQLLFSLPTNFNKEGRHFMSGTDYVQKQLSPQAMEVFKDIPTLSADGMFDNGLIGMDLETLRAEVRAVNEAFYGSSELLPATGSLGNLGSTGYLGNSAWFVPMTYTSNFTTMVTTPTQDGRTIEELLQVETDLLEEVADLSDEIQEMEDTMERIDAVLDGSGFTRSDIFLLEQRNRMEEKGWTLAFLSPSVVDLLEAKSIADYTEEGIPFFYDAGNPDVE